MLTGVDLSHWQGAVDWARVKAAGIQFAYLKASEGSGWTDSKFAANRSGCVSVGMPWGPYHFWRRAYEAAEQAAHFIRTVGSPEPDLPWALDVEDTNAPRDPVGNSNHILTVLLGLETRKKCLYSAKWFWDPFVAGTSSAQTIASIPLSVEYWTRRAETRSSILALGTEPRSSGLRAFTRVVLANFAALGKAPMGLQAADFSTIAKWVAHYTSAAAPYMPKGWTEWLIWQYTSSGRVDGISGNVDMNRAWDHLLPTQPPAPGLPIPVELRYPAGALDLKVLDLKVVEV